METLKIELADCEIEFVDCEISLVDCEIELVGCQIDVAKYDPKWSEVARNGTKWPILWG